MKKISHLSTISSVIVLAFVVPQIAFAAWWNPLSWNIFRGTDTKTQIVETPTNELENKVGNNASSTVSESKENAQKLTNETPKAPNASWWNPFSWDIFRKPNTQTQQLEDKVKELEKKLEDKTAITTSEKSKPATPPKTQLAPQTKAEPRPAVPIPVQPPVVPDQVQQPVINTAAQNYAESVSYLYKIHGEFVGKKIELLDNFVNVYESSLGDMDRYLRTFKSSLEIFNDNEKLISTLEEIFNLYEGSFAKQTNLLKGLISAFNAYKTDIETKSLVIKSEVVSSTDLETHKRFLEKEAVAINKVLDTAFQDFKRLTGDYNEEIREIADAIQRALEREAQYVRERREGENEVERLRQETNTLLMQSNLLLQQHYRSNTTYCTASNLGLGQTSIVCQ